MPNNAAGSVSVLLGDGDGSFTVAAVVLVGSNPRGVATGDFDADGDVDIAVSNELSASVSVVQGDGTGAFAARSDVSVGSFPVGVTAGDLDGDLDLDLAVTKQAGVSVLLNDGDGAFPARLDTSVAGAPIALAAADFDGDGDLDLAVAREFSATVTVLLGDGTGAFPERMDNGVGNGPFAVAVGDVNADGRPDIAVANQSAGTVSVLVNTTGVNDAPVAVDDAYSTGEDTVLVVPAPGVLGNDGDADGDPLSAALVGGPANGTLVLNADGSFTYAPNANFVGTDSFTYTASDGTATSNTATVTITVTAVNDAPVAIDDAYSIPDESVLVVPPAGVLGNDTDADGDPLLASLVSGPSSGTVVLVANGSFTYTPQTVGTFAFVYRATDPSGASDDATVTITVTEVIPTGCTITCTAATTPCAAPTATT